MLVIITYFRSSSFNTWKFCQNQYFLRYVLGFDDPSNIKAQKGTITHKALELLASQQLAKQNKEVNFIDNESDTIFSTEFFTKEMAISQAWNWYTKLQPTPFNWTQEDFLDCEMWMNRALTINNGDFHPKNRTILWPEKYFDFEIEQDWAKYKYKLDNGDTIDGRLSLKGTVDLVCRTKRENVYEMVDWKTGKRLDWNTGKVKEYDDLRSDPQLRLYHYALSRLLPQAKKIFVTIVFINDGGAFPLPFDKSDLPKTEKMIRERFDEVRDCQKPQLIYPDWKCTKLCHYGKTKWKDSNVSQCFHIKNEVQQIGIDKVTAKYGKNTFQNYGSGGGVSNRDSK